MILSFCQLQQEAMKEHAPTGATPHIHTSTLPAWPTFLDSFSYPYFVLVAGTGWVTVLPGGSISWIPTLRWKITRHYGASKESFWGGLQSLETSVEPGKKLKYRFWSRAKKAARWGSPGKMNFVEGWVCMSSHSWGIMCVAPHICCFIRDMTNPDLCILRDSGWVRNRKCKNRMRLFS